MGLDYEQAKQWREIWTMLALAYGASVVILLLTIATWLAKVRDEVRELRTSVESPKDSGVDASRPQTMDEDLRLR